MEPKGSSPHSQQPATCPYHEPYRSSPCPPHPTSKRPILILSSHLRLGHSSIIRCVNRFMTRHNSTQGRTHETASCSAQDGDEWLTSRSGRFTPRKVPWYPSNRMLHRPHRRSGRFGEETNTACSLATTRLSYPRFGIVVGKQ